MGGSEGIKYELVKFGLIVSPDNVHLLRETRSIKGKSTGSLTSQPYKIVYNPYDKSLNARTLSALVKLLQENRIRENEAALLGEYLYGALLNNSIGEELHQILYKHDDVFLCLQLKFDDPNSPLAILPWEYLYRPNKEEHLPGYFLASHERCALVRSPHYEYTRSLRVSIKTGEKVRVLFVASSPCDKPQVEFGKLKEQIESLQVEQLKVYPLVTSYTKDAVHETCTRGQAEATYENFKTQVMELEPHVIHFVGHGECGQDGGEISFVYPNYNACPILGRKLAEDLKSHKSVRLVFLQACESAVVDPTAPYAALSSVAGGLAGQGIPAVVAMQSKVENTAANNFAEAFYKALVQCTPIFQAVQAARAKIESKDALGIPVLYWIRHEDEEGILFPGTEQRIDASNQVPGGGGGLRVSAEATKVMCAWCGRSSRQGDRCSFRPCLAQLRCPTCTAFVEIQVGDIHGADEVYACKCGVRFDRKGNVESQQGFRPPADDFGEPEQEKVKLGLDKSRREESDQSFLSLANASTPIFPDQGSPD